MKYHNITKDDMNNGDGLRVVLWVSGCGHKCKGCQNPITWDPENGIPFDTAAEEEIFAELEKDYISGITFSGGDPLFPSNREQITMLAKKIKDIFPGKTIWLYTGYLMEEIRGLEVMSYVDVLVDGPYMENCADSTYHWAGSTNQKIYYLGEQNE